MFKPVCYECESGKLVIWTRENLATGKVDYQGECLNCGWRAPRRETYKDAKTDLELFVEESG